MKQPLDPIIEEIHETRRKIARQFDNDVVRISEDARKRQAVEGRPQWDSKSANKAMQRSGDICPPGVENLSSPPVDR